MIVKIDPRVQLTYCKITEIIGTGKKPNVLITMELEGLFTDSVDLGFSATYSKQIPLSVLNEDFPKDIDERQIALRKSLNWNRDRTVLIKITNGGMSRQVFT